MMLSVIGCSFHNTPVAVREHLALDARKLAHALDELNVRYGCEAVILGTCSVHSPDSLRKPQLPARET